MGGACFDLAEIITQIFGLADVRKAVGAARDEWEVLAVVSDHLNPAEREIWEAEAAALPQGITRQFGQVMSDAVRENLTFRFEGTPPDDVMGTMRERVIEVTFRYSETEIVATLTHTMRHPTWLPEVRVADLVEV